jgi:hypothetical protein
MGTLGVPAAQQSRRGREGEGTRAFIVVQSGDGAPCPMGLGSAAPKQRTGSDFTNQVGKEIQFQILIPVSTMIDQIPGFAATSTNLHPLSVALRRTYNCFASLLISAVRLISFPRRSCVLCSRPWYINGSMSDL